jgi:hypothetical protein
MNEKWAGIQWNLMAGADGATTLHQRESDRDETVLTGILLPGVLERTVPKHWTEIVLLSQILAIYKPMAAISTNICGGVGGWTTDFRYKREKALEFFTNSGDI